MKILNLMALLVGLTVTPADAGEMDRETNAREQCRIQISGLYLGFLNDFDVLKGNLTTTSASAFAMKAQRKLIEKEFKALDMVGLRYQLDTYDKDIIDIEARIAQLKDQIAVKEGEFKATKERLRPVFDVVNAKIVNQGAYPLLLQYKQSCSQFQQLCPLPPAQSAALVQIARSLEDPLACTHYANMRKN